MKKFAYLITIFLSFLIIQSHAQNASAQSLETDNVLPNDAQVDTFTYSPPSPWTPINKHNDRGYLTVGSGEFKQYDLVLTYESSNPSIVLKIEHATICGDKTRPDHYTGVDSPSADFSLPDLTTSFVFGNKFNESLNVAKIETIGRDCVNKDRNVTITNLEELPNSPGRYGGWVFIKLNYEGAISAQNSFRILAPNDNSAIVGYSSPIVNTLRRKHGTALAANGIRPELGISLTNTDAPRYSYTNFEIGLSMPCEADEDEARKNITVEFFDLDDAAGLGETNPSGSYWQGTTYFPSIEFVVLEKAPGGTWKNKLDNEGKVINRDLKGGRNATLRVDLGGFKLNYEYRFQVKKIYRANAIQFAISDNANINTGISQPICNNKPIGFIDSCELLSDGRTTVIKGWGYDNDAKNDDGLPRVKLKISGKQDMTVNTDKQYYPGRIEAWMGNVYGTDVLDNKYGWEVRYTDLDPEGTYRISGTVIDTGSGSGPKLNKDLRINGWNPEFNEDKNIYYPLNDPQIPEKCLPENDAAVSCTVFVEGNEIGVDTDINVRFRHGRNSPVNSLSVRNITLNSISGMSTSGSIAPSLPFNLPKNTTQEFTRTIKFNDPKTYGIVATVAYNDGDNKTRDCPVSHTVYIKPYLKVYGGDVWSGGRFPGSSTSGLGSIYAHANANGANSTGAASQLGVMALLNIRGFYSSSLRTSLFTATAPKGTTFANTGNSTFGGSFGAGSSLNIIDYYQDTRDTSLGSSNLPVSVPAGQGKVQYVLPANSNIGARTIGRGSQAATYVNGDVFISGNIAYDESGRTLTTDVPFFALIVRGDIYIGGNVTRLDGMYVAQSYTSGGNELGGRIYTCSAGLRSRYSSAGSAIANNCGNKLTVNGSFTAKQVKFLRHIQTLSLAPTRETRQSNGAGEVFNFSPELYIAPSPLRNGDSNSGETIKYDAIFSLPPVF